MLSIIETRPCHSKVQLNLNFNQNFNLILIFLGTTTESGESTDKASLLSAELMFQDGFKMVPYLLKHALHTIALVYPVNINIFFCNIRIQFFLSWSGLDI